MQQALSQQLKQKGSGRARLAVSKINHDLRNMLAAAQLMSDRLGAVQDPTVQRFAPKLVQTLDRAIAFCQSTLSYGRADERPPRLETVRPRDLLEEVRDVVDLGDDHPILWDNRVPAELSLASDPEHLFRIFTNLCRNAVQAMEAAPCRRRAGNRLSITYAPMARGKAFEIRDTGPGVPAKVRETLFEASRGSARPAAASVRHRRGSRQGARRINRARGSRRRRLLQVDAAGGVFHDAIVMHRLGLPELTARGLRLQTTDRDALAIRRGASSVFRRVKAPSYRDERQEEKLCVL